MAGSPSPAAIAAHELNQPLGATQLNLQFLQKRLADRALTSEQNMEVLSALLADNQRSANIIQSLRSIFSDGKIGLDQVDVNELIALRGWTFNGSQLAGKNTILLN